MERQLPKNVRQIGNVSDNPKIYVEDYVDTYLNQLREKAKEQPIGVILAGEVLELEDEKAVFVSGAVQMQELSEKDGKLEIGQDGMKHMMEEAAQYFPESHIVGWGRQSDEPQSGSEENTGKRIWAGRKSVPVEKRKRAGRDILCVQIW